MKTLSAIYQVYDDFKSCDQVLTQFHKFFPDSKVLVVSDGGADFSDLAKSHEDLFLTGPNIVNGFRNPVSAIQMKIWWERRKHLCEQIPSDYVLLLEDDVFINGHFDITEDFSLRGVMCGNNIGPKMSREICEANGWDYFLQEYGMCGGSIFNTHQFLQIYDDVIRETEELHNEKIKDSECVHWGIFDSNIVYHFAKRGFVYEKSPWLAEVNRNADWAHYPIVHQYEKWLK